jgi:glycosyltransferase involved in cell wall biosynthesis
MPEILGDTGLFFDPEDKYDMVNKIEQLLSDDELSRNLGKMAGQRASSFLWQTTAAQTYTVLKDAAMRKPNVP